MHPGICAEECEFGRVIVIHTAQKEVSHRASVVGTSPINQERVKLPDEGANKSAARFGNEDNDKFGNHEVLEDEEGDKGRVSKNAPVQAVHTLKSMKKKKKIDPQAVRAKTLTIPKDFREELRKLQQMKQKQKEKE